MIYTYANETVRSADGLLADLSACRQLRHLKDDERADVVLRAFQDRKPSLFCWLSEVFEIAIKVHGASCDICGYVTDINDDTLRKAADRCLDNIGGLTKLMLCKSCSLKCAAFCRREFEREIRVVYSPDLEKMFLAFIASEVARVAKRVERGQSPEDEREQQLRSKQNKQNR